MPERAPSLFERVPRGLFAPLGDPYADYVHGIVLPVDGGWLAR
jgi:hypothetical protein